MKELNFGLSSKDLLIELRNSASLLDICMSLFIYFPDH